MEKRGGFLVRGVVSLILGFIPSFLFVYVFVQYGSPFSNYIKFMSNFRTSWAVWALAIFLMIIFYSIGGLINYRKRNKDINKSKVGIFLITFFLLLAGLLITAQLYLYTKFLLGNDLLVELTSDKDNLFFIDSQIENVTFKISATMNLFCSAQCHYEFYDISNGKLIESGDFNLTSLFPKTKEYFINKDNSEKSQALNRFEVSCTNQKTKLCLTRGEESKRSILITLNYDLDPGERKFTEESKNEIVFIGKTLHYISQNLSWAKVNLENINESFLTLDFLNKLGELSDKSSILNNSFWNLIDLWEGKNFEELKIELKETAEKTQNLSLDAISLQKGVISNITAYNSLSENLTGLMQKIKDIYFQNLSNYSCAQLNAGIDDFNQTIIDFPKNLRLNEKIYLVDNLNTEINVIVNGLENDSNYSCALDSINDPNIAKINITSIASTAPEIVLEESDPICCFYGSCEKCCDEGCSDKNYPIIFLHGHSVNKALPADYSLDALGGLKKRFAESGYIDAGAIVISPVEEEVGLWGRVNAPIAVTASYYFDVYKTEDGEVTVPSKTDSIDTYAIRLKDIIKIVKHRTNKNKAIIVAHSMGGLVTRRYAEVFGGEDIDKVILIATPNHGIDDKVKSSCSLLGPESACSDMNEDSLFINRLNNAPAPSFPIYTIIGNGCFMGDETGDGIVKNSSQYLSYATNYYIEGSCDELAFKFLHSEIVDPSKYPKVYEIIKDII